MSSYMLQKVKEYLEENLKKKFITFSKASFASSILFVEKKDDSLCFCMNYRKCHDSSLARLSLLALSDLFSLRHLD